MYDLKFVREHADELRRAVADRLPEKHRSTWTRERPIEMRPVEPIDYFKPSVRDPVRNIWFKASHTVPEDPTVQRCLLAYQSDFALLATSLLPHGVTFVHRGMQVASVDHAMWFHREFRVDEIECVAAGGETCTYAIYKEPVG